MLITGEISRLGLWTIYGAYRKMGLPIRCPLFRLQHPDAKMGSEEFSYFFIFFLCVSDTYMARPSGGWDSQLRFGVPQGVGWGV